MLSRKRYFDVLCLYKCNICQVSLFKNYIDSTQNFPLLSWKIEHNNPLNFLDFSKTKLDGKYKFNIYNKPTHTSQVIYANLCVPFSHKMVAFMLHRLLSLPLTDEDHAAEVNTVKFIAQENWYKPSNIERLYIKMKSRPAIKKAEKKFVTLDYSTTAERIACSAYKDVSITVAYGTKP